MLSNLLKRDYKKRNYTFQWLHVRPPCSTSGAKHRADDRRKNSWRMIEVKGHSEQLAGHQLKTDGNP